MRQLLVALLFLACYASAAHVRTAPADDIICTSGALQFRCPATAPTCCARRTGIVAACCPLNSRCDLRDGACLKPINSSTTSKGGDSGSGSEGMVRERGILLSIPSAAGAISIALMLAMAVAAFSSLLGFKCFIMRRERRLRQEESDRQALLAAQRAADEAEEAADAAAAARIDATDDELPESLACLVCLSRPKDAVMMDCGHVCTCHRCARRLDKCPLCRTAVKKVLRIPLRGPYRAPLAGGSAASPAPSSDVVVDVGVAEDRSIGAGADQEDHELRSTTAVIADL